MLFEHLGKSPVIHKTAYIAPNAVICGDIIIGENCRILFGAVISAEGGTVKIGNNCIVMENAVIRGTKNHPVILGNSILAGPHSYMSGCTVEDEVFLATGSSVFNGAVIGKRAEVRINGVVHLKTRLLPDSVVPIGWIAVGDPARMLPPEQHEKIWSVQKPLDFPRTVFGLERAPAGESILPQLTDRYSRALAKHKNDRIIDGEE